MFLEGETEKPYALKAYIYCAAVMPTMFSGLAFERMPLVIIMFAAAALALSAFIRIVFPTSKLTVFIFLGQAVVLFASYFALIWRNTSLNGLSFLLGLPLLIVLRIMAQRNVGSNNTSP